MSFLIRVFLKFKHKRDGYGIKNMLRWWGILVNLLSTPLVIIYIWEATTDLQYYVTAIRVMFQFLCVNSLLFVTFDRTVYVSLYESAQQQMSSIFEDPGNEEDEQVQEVVDLAGESEATPGIELEDTSVDPASPDEAEAGAGSPAKSPSGDAPEVFSSTTLALPLNDILLNPVYAAQMQSFARHLVGEFNVEGLLFFYRVRNFQNFANSEKKSETEENGRHENSKQEDQKTEQSKSSNTGTESEDYVADIELDFNIEVAWKALLVYFEFLADGSPAEVRNNHILYFTLHHSQT